MSSGFPVTVYEVFGIVLTIATACLAYMKSAGDTKKMHAAFVSILGVVLTTMLSVRFDFLPSIERHLVIGESVDVHPELKPLFEAIATAKMNSQSDNSLVKEVNDVRMSYMVRQFDLMAKGQFEIDQSELPQFALKMISSAKKSIVATSYIQPGKWWERSWGLNYETLNETASKRGIKIRRTFVYREDSELESIRKFLDMQKAAALKCVYCELPKLRVNLRAI